LLVGRKLVLVLVRKSKEALSGEGTCQWELSKQRGSTVGDGRRPLAGATDRGKLPKTRAAGSPVNDQWAGEIERAF
jgi:hypothetical protein